MGDNLPVISVIVPTFNRATLLKDTINSIIKQTYKDWELIIVDDGSTDGTALLLSQLCLDDKRIRYVSRPSSMVKGANTCRNFGMKLSQGKYIKWLDSDDMIEPTCLQKQFVIMEREGCDVTFCQTGYFKNENDNIVIIEKVWGRLTPLQNAYDEYLKGGLRWQTGAGLWRKDFFKDEPYLDGLMNSQEWLMQFKYLLQKPKMYFLDETLCLARKHQGSMSDKAHKKSKYYYHQCWSRYEAANLLAHSGELTSSRMKLLYRSFWWNHLFVFYKGGVWKGILLIKYYFSFFKYLIQSRND